MGFMQSLKAEWEATSQKSKPVPRSFRNEMLVDGGETTIAFLYTEGAKFISFEIRNNTFVSVDLDISEISSLIATTREMRYDIHSGYYTTKSGPHEHLRVSQNPSPIVGQRDRNVVIEVLKDQRTVTASITRLEFEIFDPLLQDYFKLYLSNK